jgi:hypothetical protein
MRWVGRVACMGEMRNVYKFWLENMNGRDHLEDVGVDGKILLEFILGEWCGLYSSGSGQGLVAGRCEHCNKPLGSIKGGEFLDRVTVSFPRRTFLHGVG